MKVTDLHTLVNTSIQEVIGETAVVNEDLSNLIDIGRQTLLDANSSDHFVRSLVDKVGRVEFVNRSYTGFAPSLKRDAWEYGAILQKIQTDLVEAEEDPAWNLQDGVSYDPHVFYKPTASSKFWSDIAAYQFHRSITQKQVKSAFNTAAQMNSFVSMLENWTNHSVTMSIDELALSLVSGLAAEIINGEFPGGVGITAGSGVRAKNLLYLYNNGPNAGNTAISASAAWYDRDFLRFASLVIQTDIDRLAVMSRLFNQNEKARFTPRDLLHKIFHTDFYRAAGVYLYNGVGQFSTDNLNLPSSEIVPYWQGTGTDYNRSSTTKIDIKLPTDNTTTVSMTGLVGVMFDWDAIGIFNEDRHTTSEHNPLGEFTNFWYKYRAGYWMDLDENAICYFIA